MVQFLSPGIKVIEQESKIRNIRGVATSIGAFIGTAERGPIGKATLITSFEDFLNTFGGFTAYSQMGRAVNGFYQNAGEGAPVYIVRTAHYTDITNASSLTAVKATTILTDALAANTLRVNAANEGAWGNKLQISTTLSSKFSTTINDAAGLPVGATSVNLASVEGVRIGSVLKFDDTTDNVTVVITDIQNNRVFFAATVTHGGGGGPIADGAAVTEQSFDIQVYEADVLVEEFLNVSMEDTNLVDYVEARINGVSQFIEVEDLDSASDPPSDRPANTVKKFLVSGNNGLSGLTPADFAGNSGSKTGLYALDEVQVINLISIPDSQTQVAQLGLMAYCELRKFPLGILSSPLGLNITQAVNYVTTTLAANTSRSAFFYPQLKVFDSATASEILVPAEGHIMGIYARTDGNIGVQQVGAGEYGQIQGITGFENKLTESQGNRDILYPNNINPLARIEGLGRVVFGSRTLSLAGGIGSQINERRTFAFVEQSLDLGMKWVLFKNNTPEFRKTVEQTIASFLAVLRLDGVLEDFFVDVGEGLNNALVRAQHKLVALVGLKVPDTIEFFELIVTKDTRAQEAALAELV